MNRITRPQPTPEKQLAKAAEQVQSNLKAAMNTAELDALASYYTLTDPIVRGEPFCVCLARATFLFHMRMERVQDADADAYVRLISKINSLISPPNRTSHPFITKSLREDLFGMTQSNDGHNVVLLPVQQYRAWSYLVSELIIETVIPDDLITAIRVRWTDYSQARSPLVSLRSQTLLVRTSIHMDTTEDLTELQRIIRNKPTRMNVDLIMLCYERLQRLVPSAIDGPAHCRALSILSSEVFLKLRSPIRKHYVENYLYPSLAAPDTRNYMENESTRRHLVSQLLRMCTLGMKPGNPFYMCLCAIVQRELVNEGLGSLELVSMMEYQMPHAAYFISALAVDPHMSQDVFVKMMMLLVRGAAHVMAKLPPDDNAIAAAVNNRSTMVYNILFTLRDIIRQVSTTATKHSLAIAAALRRNIRYETIDALGNFAAQAFAGCCDIAVQPQLLCGELGMILHDHHIEEAIDTCASYFKTASSRCHYCGAANGSSVLCHVNGTVHLADRAVFSRVLCAVADCSGSSKVHMKLKTMLCDTSVNCEPSVHQLVFYIISHAGQHKVALLEALEPHIGNLLLTVLDADTRGAAVSECKASVLMLWTRLVTHLPPDPARLQVTLKAMLQLTIRSEHDVLAMWNVCHRLIRVGKANVDLQPLDPSETNYASNHSAIAPTSFAAADNAQLLLNLLAKVHGFNAVSRKLTGCSVCKLIQDFNVQAPNVIGVLVDSLGTMPATVSSASSFGFPTSPDTIFWRFIIKQMKKSAPARTAIMTSVARCFGHRFRLESPSSAITVGGEDTSSNLFIIALLQCMKSHAPLARIVMYVLSEWVPHKGHSAGKFTCLVYICTQLTMSLKCRVSEQLPTPQDTYLFSESIKQGSDVLSKALSEVRTLMPHVQENQQFHSLLGRLSQSIGVVLGEEFDFNNFQPAAADDMIFDVEQSKTEDFGAAFQNNIYDGLEVASLEHVVADDECFDLNDQPDYYSDYGDYPQDVTGGGQPSLNSVQSMSSKVGSEITSSNRTGVASFYPSLFEDSISYTISKAGTSGVSDSTVGKMYGSSSTATTGTSTISDGFALGSTVTSGQDTTTTTTTTGVVSTVTNRNPSTMLEGAGSHLSTDLSTVTSATLVSDTTSAHFAANKSVNGVRINHPIEVLPNSIYDHMPEVVEMYVPTREERQEACSQTSPMNREDAEAAPIPFTSTGLPKLPPISRKGPLLPCDFPVPSDVALDYLCNHQNSSSAVHELQMLQSSPMGNMGSPADRKLSNAFEAAITVDTPNGYNAPHQHQRHFPNSTVMAKLVASQGGGSALHEITLMQEAGQEDSSGPRKRRRDAELKSYNETEMGKESCIDGFNPIQESTPRSKIIPLDRNNRVGSKPSNPAVYQRLAEQSGETALREIRQAMGTANPNTFHNFNGQLRKPQPLSHNNTYNTKYRHANLGNIHYNGSWQEDATRF